MTVFTAPISVRLRAGQPALDGWCGRMMDLRVGEIVLVLENRPGEFIAYPKRLATPDLVGRIERYE